MMKVYQKIGLLISLLSYVSFTTAAPFKAGKHYTILEQQTTSVPELINFFSFFCFQCYTLEYQLNLHHEIKRIFPLEGRIKYYHVSNADPLSQALTRAWATAIVLEVENKVQKLIYEGIQRKEKLYGTDDIRNAFIQAGVSAEKYDSTVNSFCVNTLVYQQESAVRSAKIYGVPAMVVNGKFKIKLTSLPYHNEQEFAQQYLQLVKFLLNKKS